MTNRLTRLEVKNFRSLADVDISLNVLNVLFGPNGAGKSTLLDTIWFIRDCAIRGVEEASSDRSHGIGALWDRADETASIAIKLENDVSVYQVRFGYSSGRIESFVGESLKSKETGIHLVDRKIGSDKANFYHVNLKQTVEIELREAEKLALARYLDFTDSVEANSLNELLRYVHLYNGRNANLYQLKTRGSELTYHPWLWERSQNLWSVLWNLLGKRAVDDRYETIMLFMRKALPGFVDLSIELVGSNTAYASFVKSGRARPIQASGESDGHLQMLILLTALFCEGKSRHSIIMFDEPETSLHPYALAVFAEAVKLAVTEWNKQVFIATHSPVLISQFEPDDILVTELGEQEQTILHRVSEIESIQDLLETYAVGSLYMAEAVAPQSK
jgi:predicted ATPase